jgi:hypothetical protein
MSTVNHHTLRSSRCLEFAKCSRIFRSHINGALRFRLRPIISVSRTRSFIPYRCPVIRDSIRAPHACRKCRWHSIRYRILCRIIRDAAAVPRLQPRRCLLLGRTRGLARLDAVDQLRILFKLGGSIGIRSTVRWGTRPSCTGIARLGPCSTRRRRR